MKTTTITLFGHEYKLALNFAALICFERITEGKNALDFNNFTKGSIEHLVCLCYAMIKANNDDDIVPEFQQLLDITDPALMLTIVQTTTDLYLATMKREQGDPAPAKDAAGEEEGEPKNA